MGLFTKTKGNGWNFDKNSGTLYIDGKLDNVSKYFNKIADKVRRIVCRKGAVLTAGTELFKDMRNLETADLSALDVSGCTSFGYMFSCCTSLKVLDLSSWDIRNARNMERMFFLCRSLKKIITGPQWIPHKVTDTGSMFNSCGSLETIEQAMLDLPSITYCSYMFQDCGSLRTLNLRGMDVRNAVYMRSIFSGCKNLRELDLSGWQIPDQCNTENMFEGLSGSVRIYADDDSVIRLLPDGIQARSHEPEQKQCPVKDKETPSVNEPEPKQSTVKDKKAQSVNKPKPKENTVKDKETQSLHAQEQNDRIIQGSGWSFDPDTGALTFSGIIEKVPDAFGSFAEQVLTVKALKGAALRNGRNMFKGMKNLALADLRKLDVSQCTDFTYMFGSCNALKVLDLSSWDFTNAATVNHMFSGCTALEEIITGPKWIPRNLSTAVFMFSGCRKLQELDFSAWAEAPLENTCGMFYGCTSLRELDLSMIHTAKIKNIGNMFNGCTDLQSLHLDGWDVSAAEKMDAMFKECGSLTELNLSGWDVSGVSDMTWMFGGCEKLKTLDLRGWRIDKRTDTENMFRSLPKTVHICADDKSVVNSLPDYLKVKAVQAEIQTSEKERTAPSVKETEPAHAVPENIETGLPEDAYSLYLRAIGYCNGTEGLPQDLNQALQTALAAKEHAEGQLLNNIRYLIAQIGWMHTYDREDESEDMIGQRRDAAKNGDTNALLDLANRLYFGSEYVDKDPEEALICAVQIKYSRFSENKLYAENLLEVLRENSLYDTLAAGLEAEKSGYLAEAFKQYEKAALQGSAAGMWYLSRMYRDGKGTAANLKKSDAFKELAASLGWGEALFTDAKDSFNTYIKGGSAEEARDKIRKAEAYGHRLSKNQNHELGKMEVRVLQVLGY